MSFPAYEEYKDSSVEWLGTIPEHWTATPIKYAARNGEGTFTDGDWIETPFITDDGVRLIQCGNVGTGCYEEQGFRYISDQTFDQLNCTEIEPNDVLICRLQSSRTILAGRACLAPDLGVRMITSVDNVILKTTIDFDSRFIVYQLSTIEYLSFIKLIARGGTRDRISRTMLGTVGLAKPPLPEQTAIASFLDVETSKIDGLVSEQRLLIELLKEKRQAVISHAVTKGLDPSVPMKDSGIQWLGEVPEHWEVASLKHYVSTVNGFGFSSSDFQDDGVPFIRAGNIKHKSIRPPTIFLPEKVVAKYERVILAAGDIVISMVGSDPKIIESAVGQVGIVPEHLAGAVPNQNVVIMRENRDFILSRYLFYTLCGTAYRNHLNVFSHKLANQSIISSSLLVAAKFTFANKQEQQAIVAALDELVETSNQLLSQAERAIELLQERRTALISAAVTGKIDVREFATEAVA